MVIGDAYFCVVRLNDGPLQNKREKVASLVIKIGQNYK
jgi:hypothetical protein